MITDLNQPAQGDLTASDNKRSDSDTEDEYNHHAFLKSNHQRYLELRRDEVVQQRKTEYQKGKDKNKKRSTRKKQKIQTDDSMEEVEAFSGGGEDSNAMWRLTPDGWDQVGNLTIAQATGPMAQIEGLTGDGTHEREASQRDPSGQGVVYDDAETSEGEETEGVEASDEDMTGPIPAWPALPRAMSVDANFEVIEAPETRRRFSEEPGSTQMATTRRIGPIVNGLDEEYQTPVEYATEVLGLETGSQSEEDDTSIQQRTETEGSTVAVEQDSLTERVLTLAEYQRALMGDDYNTIYDSSEAERKDSATGSVTDAIFSKEFPEPSRLTAVIPFTRQQRESLRSRQHSSPPPSPSPSPGFSYGYTAAYREPISRISRKRNPRAKRAADNETQFEGQARKPLKHKVRQLTAFG